MLRLRTPAEIKVSESKCQRSKTTGSLLVVMPKVNPRENAISIRAEGKTRASAPSTLDPSKPGTARLRTGTGSNGVIPKKLTLHEQMMADALAARSSEHPQTSASSSAVDIRTIVKQKDSASEAIETVFRKNNASTETLIEEIRHVDESAINAID
jgi:hypothetical protein